MAVANKAEIIRNLEVPSTRKVPFIAPGVRIANHENARIPTERQQLALKNFMTRRRQRVAR